MLVLTRRKSEKIMVGNDITIEILTIGKDNVRIGITAPKEITVVRTELLNHENQNIRTDKQGGEVKRNGT